MLVNRDRGMGRSVALFAGMVALAGASGCARKARGPAHRERSVLHDADCREPTLPHAFMYPARNRTEYGPDDPKADGCVLLVPDHLFCCPNATRPTDE